LDITVGNFTGITAFQADLSFNGSELTFLSFTDAGALSHQIIFNSGSSRLLFFQPDQSGNTVAGGTVIGTVCFTNLNAGASTAGFVGLTSRDNNGTALPTIGNDGSINNCGTMPTCTDGILNGNETGVDCGGPDCGACPTGPTCTDGMMNGDETGVDCGGPDCGACNTGGPNLDCGMGTTDVTLCFGDACDVAVNGTACLDITVGNFTGITAFQADLSFNGSELTFLSFTDAGALSHQIIFNSGSSRLLFFQPDQSGNTVAGGTVIGTVCFTNLNAGASTAGFVGLTSRDNSGAALPTSGSSGSVNACVPTGPTCTDGVLNGNETGVDCGGPDCPTCPTCTDGIMNGNETGVDCGGSCAPCLTICGEGTTDVQFCVGTGCAAAGAEVCIPVFIGNFTQLGGLQFSLDYTAANLNFSQVIPNALLAPGTTSATPGDGRINLTWNDISLAGVTLGAEDVAFEICFTVETVAETPVTFFNPSASLRAFDVLGQTLPTSGNPGSVNTNCPGDDTCDDGIMNGSETGVDCGGPDCDACVTCDDGIMNGSETGVDCGGPDCDACVTCDDGIMNGSETGVDCGGPDCAACPPNPTCDDGIMNGNETGIDCGGPDCAACPTTGGPDTDCGMGTTDLVFCLGDACSIGANGQACIDITAGNLTDITAFQMDIIFDDTELAFVSFTHAGALSHQIISNTSGGAPRLLFFQPDQSGNTIANGTIIGTVCFTNLNGAAASAISLTGLSARDNNGFAVPVSGSDGTVNGCVAEPTCTDGMMNGNETGVDCGGPDCMPCSVPFSLDVQDGMANIGETVCVDVNVGDFTNITDLGLTLNFDPSVLQLSSVTAITSLPGFGAGNFTTSAGQIVVDYNSATPRSLADAAALFTVCWTVLNGNQTNVTITSSSATNGDGTDLTVTSSNGVINAGGGSEEVTFAIGTVTGGVNQVVCLDVTTLNFDEILGLQFAITYDSTKLQFNSATSTGALVALQASNPTPGVIRVIWSDLGLTAQSLADGTAILDFCFTVLQACDAPVEIQDISGFPIRVTDADNMTISTVDVVNGAVNNGITCQLEPPSNLVLDIGTASGGIGQTVCVDIIVDNFTNLTNLSLSINYDQDVVSFNNATNFGLSGLNGTNVTNNSSTGVLTFEWEANTSAGQTLPDGGRLLSLCFQIDVLMPTNVSFANGPVNIMARNADGQNVGVIPSGGNINPDVPVIDGTTFDIGDATGEVGETICLPVLAYQTGGMIAFQFTITYNPAILQFIPGNNEFAYNGFLIINGNTPGILRVLWDDQMAMGNFVTDGSTIFQICFEILSDDSDIVCFADSPTAIEFQNTDGIIADPDLLCGQVNGAEAPSIVSADIENPSCFGESDGSISLTVSGSGSLTYDWTPNVGNGPSVDGLPAGAYSVLITNTETGQTTTGGDYLLSTLPFQINVASSSGVTCFRESDGSICIGTIGGTPPFLYDWSGSLQDGVACQTELDGGSYSVTVTDNNGCSMILNNINIGEPEELMVSGTPINIGENPGGVNVVVTGGRTPYTYAWTGENGYINDVRDINDVTDPGTYCITVTDNNDCTDIQCFAIQQALRITSIDISNGCSGEDNGCIDIEVEGGNGSYDYDWKLSDGTSFANTQDVCDLAPGDYTVMISSGTEMTTGTFTVDTPSIIMVPGSVINSTSGNNGSITITPSGGSPGYSFEWADGPTTQNRTDLASGEYCVTVTDSNECPVSECFTVGSAPVSFMSTSTMPTSCFDGEDGIIRLVISNGARPFTVRIEPIGTVVVVDSNTIEVMVPAGTWDVSVTDAQNAEITTTLTVGSPSAISATSSLTSDTEDDGCSGMISLDVDGGTSDYTVTWSDMQDGPTISQLCSGEYTATITDANGCEFITETFTVGRIDEVQDSINSVACEDGIDGFIQVSVSGGVGPLEFSWTRTGEATELADTEDISDIGPGDYTLTITDATGATLVKNYTVGIAAGFVVFSEVTSNYSGFGVSCAGATDGSAVATISGQGDFDFEWFLNDTTVDTDSILNDVGIGTYLLIVTSAGGCEIERTIQIDGPTALVLTPTITPISCGSTNDGMISVVATGGVENYIFEWSNGSMSPQIQSLGSGDYGLTVTDANNCIMEESFTLIAPEDLAITFQATDATDGCNGSVQILPLGGSGTYRYFWPQLPNQGNSPLAEGLCPGDYTLEVTDANGCQTVIMTATVRDRRFPCLSAREVITPNGDGLNEAFILFCSEDATVANNNLEIYNRWGQLVYETEDYNCSDDGGMNCFRGDTNDGTDLPAGPYYYIFNYTNEFDEKRQQRGSLTIVRE
jgi:gliding motility-associated-like protein